MPWADHSTVDCCYFWMLLLLFLIRTHFSHQLSLIPAPSLQNRRYSSVARIHSMTIEAPITKVSPFSNYCSFPQCAHTSWSLAHSNPQQQGVSLMLPPPCFTIAMLLLGDEQHMGRHPPSTKHQPTRSNGSVILSNRLKQ